MKMINFSIVFAVGYLKATMKKSLLTLIIFLFALTIQAQKDTVNIAGVLPQKTISREGTSVNVTIFPVPVRENSFTIKADRDMSYVKVTNIIGQDILRMQYNSPQQYTKIFLDNPKRGIYLVAIIFSDGTKVVRKIMVEETE
jgi:hypothetical protein